MMENEQLLDNDNIERELPSSLTQELKRSSNWLLITTVVAIIIGILCSYSFFLALGEIKYMGNEYLIFIGSAFLLACTCFYFALWQFKLSRAVQWLDRDYAQFDFKEVQRCASKTWRSFGFILFLMAMMILSSLFLSYQTEEAVQATVPERLPELVEPAQVDSSMTSQMPSDTIIDNIPSN